MSFKDRFYKKVAKDHASRLERALNEESWAVEWFRGLEEIAIWLESIEHLRVSCVDKIIEQKVEKIYSKETNADEILALIGEETGVCEERYRSLVRYKYPSMYHKTKAAGCLYLFL